MVSLTQLLNQFAEEILTDAKSALSCAHLKHYEAAGAERCEQYLKKLYELTVSSIESRNLEPMIAYAEDIATEYFVSDFNLHEVQMAFNVLEEAIWKYSIEKLDSSELAEALGLVSTALGTGKDALACRYVSLASKTHASSLNLSALFDGPDGVWEHPSALGVH